MYACMCKGLYKAYVYMYLPCDFKGGETKFGIDLFILTCHDFRWL